MVSKLLLGLGLMAVCVTVHAFGITSAIRWLRGRPDSGLHFWLWIRRFIMLAVWMVILHLVEIAVWASFYSWRNAMPDFQSAVYFSAVTYTTTGYGDLVLASPWRLVGAIEALTGILMCGWSTGFFFAIVSRMDGGHPAKQTIET
jgi:ion channel